MARLGLLPTLLAALLAANAPGAVAAPLPCADAVTETVEAFVGSLNAPGINESAVANGARALLTAGSLQATLNRLAALEQLVGQLVSNGRLAPDRGDAVLTLLAQLRAVLGSCTASRPVAAFNARSGDAENELLWLNPPATLSVATTILYRTDRYPEGPYDALASRLGTYIGPPASVQRVRHANLANGTRVYYAAFADPGSGELSPGRLTFGQPQAPGRGFRWSYTVGPTNGPTVGGSADALATPSSVGFVFGLGVGPSGGSWTPSWVPSRVPSPAAARPIFVGPPALPQALAFVSSLDGQVYALDATTGAAVWASPPLLGTVRASVCGVFSALGGATNLLFVGTAQPAGPNRVYALNPGNGTIAWSFDGGGGRSGLGPMSSTCAIDYARSRVYFSAGSLQRGSPAAVFALSFAAGTQGLAWSTPVTGVATAPVQRGGVVYVGTSSGQVHALSADSGTPMWRAPWATGDGAVKDFVFPGRTGGGQLAFSTSRLVHLIRDDGASASAAWLAPVPLQDPNVPLIIDGSRVIVADASGTVHELDATSPTPTLQVFGVFGSPSRPRSPGPPYYDSRFGLYVVGNREGVVHAVQRETVACPCFSAENLAQRCPEGATFVATCPIATYSYQAFCSYPSCLTCPAANLGLMSVNQEAGSCYREAWDPITGNAMPVSVTGLSPAQVDACKALIVASPNYPASCPGRATARLADLFRATSP